MRYKADPTDARCSSTRATFPACRHFHDNCAFPFGPCPLLCQSNLASYSSGEREGERKQADRDEIRIPRLITNHARHEWGKIMYVYRLAHCATVGASASRSTFQLELFEKGRHCGKDVYMRQSHAHGSLIIGFPLGESQEVRCPRTPRSWTSRRESPVVEARGAQQMTGGRWKTSSRKKG